MRLTLVLLAVVGTVAVASMQTSPPGGALVIQRLSTQAALVTGGDVLLQITLPAATSAGSLRVSASGRDVTGAFRAGASANAVVGLVTGLAIGRTTIDASAGSARGSLEVT